jgi:hypothetical protein
MEKRTCTHIRLSSHSNGAMVTIAHVWSDPVSLLVVLAGPPGGACRPAWKVSEPISAMCESFRRGILGCCYCMVRGGRLFFRNFRLHCFQRLGRDAISSTKHHEIEPTGFFEMFGTADGIPTKPLVTNTNESFERKAHCPKPRSNKHQVCLFYLIHPWQQWVRNLSGRAGKHHRTGRQAPPEKTPDRYLQLWDTW